MSETWLVLQLSQSREGLQNWLKQSPEICNDVEAFDVNFGQHPIKCGASDPAGANDVSAMIRERDYHF